MKKLVNIIDDIKYRIEEINDYSCIITSNRRNSINDSFACDGLYYKDRAGKPRLSEAKIYRKNT